MQSTSTWGSDRGTSLFMSGKCYFTVRLPAERFELWVTDGTVSGSSRIINLAMPWSMRSTDRFMVEVNGRIVFPALDPALGDELWVSDGTSGGTYLLADLNPGSTGSDPRGLVSMGGAAYFHAMTPGAGRELWRTDGTPANTAIVTDISVGSSIDANTEILATPTRLFFGCGSDIEHARPFLCSQSSD